MQVSMIREAVDHEVVSVYPFSSAQIDRLLTVAPECVLIWATRSGWPVGVVHAFVWRDERIWVTFAAHRHRAAAIRRDPRVAVVVSGFPNDEPSKPQGSITIKGRAVFHDDNDTKAWFYPALARKKNPNDKEQELAFTKLLDSPLRVVLEIIPEKWITFDADKSARHRAGTLEESELGPLLSADAERMNIERAKRGLPPRDGAAG